MKELEEQDDDFEEEWSVKQQPLHHAPDSKGRALPPDTSTPSPSNLWSYVIPAMVGVSILFCTIVTLLSQINQEWATFFSSLAISIQWQLGIAIIFFTVLYTAIKIFFQNQFNEHKRAVITLLVIAVFIISLPILALLFDRPLDIFDIIFGLIINVLGGMLVNLIDKRIG